MDTQVAEPLKVADLGVLKNELSLLPPNELAVPADDTDPLMKHAAQTVDDLFNTSMDDLEAIKDRRNAVEGMGLDLQASAAKKSQMLKQPIAKLAKTAEDGGPVANALVDLKLKVEELDPAQVDFSPGWFSRMLGWLPLVGTPIKRYFTKYESADTVLSAITNSLRKGADQLKRDNITMTDDQQDMRALTVKLEQAIKVGMAIDTQLSRRLESDVPSDDPKYKFLQDEILFPLRQRIMSLQQQLAVNQQGVLSLELIIRNNKELIRGVNRALNVTVNALQVAVTVALALANQKIVLQKINAVNETTNNLIADNARRLKEQGAEIQKQAVSTQLDIDKLKQAFADIRSALDDISTFRQEALPQMANSILELNKITDDQAKAVEDLQKGNRVASTFQIELE